MLKRTPLFESHRNLGGRLIEFGGWEMPVQYTGIVDEHLAVRKAAGIFDISHMGEFEFRGQAAGEFLNYLLANDLNKIGDGQGQYSFFCKETGGVVDDLYVYRLAPDQFFMIVNASRIEADEAWVQDNLKKFPGVGFQNRSDEFGAIAVQGPKADGIIDEVIKSPIKLRELPKNHTVWVNDMFIARTGYTGEPGFEVLAPAQKIAEIWERFLAIGKPHGLVPAGLGARDTLRTEMCYPLYGHELDEETTPVEAGLNFFVGWEKGSFIGKEKLLQQKEEGISKKLVAFRMTDRSAPPRPHYGIFDDANNRIGEVTSGTQSPSLNAGIGLGYVKPEFAKKETPLKIEIRGKQFPAIVVAKPIYKKQ